MTQPAPLIYTPRFPPAVADPMSRAFAGIIALACAGVLAVAWFLVPSAAGVGTHTSLGLGRCGMIDRFDMPCFSCGMTTSFTHFAHGNIAAAFYVQPAGGLLAILTVAVFWAALYIAITGKPAWRLLSLIPARYYLWLMFFGIAAWAWKIFIYKSGMDGW